MRERIEAVKEDHRGGRATDDTGGEAGGDAGEAGGAGMKKLSAKQKLRAGAIRAKRERRYQRQRILALSPPARHSIERIPPFSPLLGLNMGIAAAALFGFGPAAIRALPVE